MLPAKYKLDDAAMIVWSAAKKGRENARAGLRASSSAFMEGLYGVANQSGLPSSLTRIARSAAADIKELLVGATAQPAEKGIA